MALVAFSTINLHWSGICNPLSDSESNYLVSLLFLFQWKCVFLFCQWTVYIPNIPNIKRELYNEYLM